MFTKSLIIKNEELFNAFQMSAKLLGYKTYEATEEAMKDWIVRHRKQLAKHGVSLDLIMEEGENVK